MKLEAATLLALKVEEKLGAKILEKAKETCSPRACGLRAVGEGAQPCEQP